MARLYNVNKISIKYKKFMKKITTFFAMMICAVVVMANPVEPEQASTVALHFMMRQMPAVTRSTECTLAYTKSNDRSDALFYVYNVGGGFVIVAADDAVTPVLGYSTTGSFNPQNIPANCAAWLQGYADQIAIVKEHHLSAPAKVSTEWTELVEGREPVRSGNTRAVSPLLTTTWNQWPYYNALCPEDASIDPYLGGRVPTGCVATAIAQIINYHQWPSQGLGTHRYNYEDEYGMQSADFGNTIYRYDLMPDELDENSTPEQVNAVATLMRDCGVAVNMLYGPDGSAAGQINTRAALINYFGYNAEMALRDYKSLGIIINTYNTTIYYDDDEWKAMLKNELDAHNPIYYDGSTFNLQGAAHAFVCDGYDANDYFHFNWGWGYGGEYYAVGSLIPEGADTLYYPSNNGVIFCRPNTSDVHRYLFSTEGRSTMTVSESLDISHCYSYNENYTCGASTDWMWVGDTLILYPQTEGTQLLLEKIAYNNNSSNRYRIYVYDGVGTDGNLLMTVEDNTPTAPAMSTTGALTLVPNRGRCTIQNELLLRVSELDCMPPVYGFACTDQTFATAEFAWNMLNPEEYADFNFNWRVEYGPHGFTPGTGTMVPSNTTSLSIGGLTADTEYDAYLRYTCSGGVSKMVGPVTFKTERVMVCFDEGIPYNSGPSSYAHDWSEQIYTAAELSASGLVAGDVLTAFSLQRTYTYNGNYFAEVTLTHSSAIYMGHTNEANFNTNGWLPLSAMTNVFTYKQTVYDIKETRWEKFEFDNPFVWDGHSNVVIAIADLEHSISSNNASVSPRTVYTSSESDSRLLYCNPMDPNPMILPDDYHRDNSRPLIRFCRQENCPDPSHLTYTSLNRHSVQVEWMPGYQETTWNVEYGPAGFERGTGTQRTINGNPRLILTQLASGYYDFYVQADCGGGETSEWMKLLIMVGDFDCVQMGEGASTTTSDDHTFPMGYASGYYDSPDCSGCYDYNLKYTYTQQIYTAAELADQGLAAGDNIQSLSFQYSGTHQTKSPVSVWMGNTLLNDFYYNSFIPVADMQEVFSGEVTLDGEWITIAFSSPFLWDGTSNIVVAFLNNSGTDNGSYSSTSYYTSGSPMAKYGRCNYFIDVENPSSIRNISNNNYRNNMRFCKSTSCALRRDVEVSIIEGSTYDFYGTPITEPGIYAHRWWINDECDSLVMLHVNVRKIIFVTTTGSGSHDGTSWANAMQLQEAMDTCVYFTDRTPYLYVKKGNYTGNTSATNSFEIKPNVHAYGGFVGNEPADYDLNNRTQNNMDATYLNGSNARRVLYQSTDFTEATATLFDGFTITGGTVNNEGEGGAAYIRQYCTLNNCKITSNNAAISGETSDITRSGVAVYNNGGTLTNCEIYNNRIDLSGTGSGYNVYGVGVYTNNGVIDHCNIYRNTAVYEGTGDNWNVYGGGIYDYQNSLISNNTITLNSAANGGGIYSNTASQVSNCIISNNTARANGGGVFVNRYGTPRFTQCLIGNNAAGSYGGGAFTYNNNVLFVACDIVRNSAVTDGGGLFTSSTNCTVQNSIVWGNRVGATHNQLGKNGNYFFAMQNSAVQGGYSGAITLEPDNTGTGVGYPHFTNPTLEAGVDVSNAIGDWTLQAGSICADMGSNTYVSDIATDLNGNDRIQQERADIGVFESGLPMSFPIHPETDSKIIYVTTTGAGSQDGSSWDNATADLQYAMDVAMVSNPPAVVWVAEGTYTPGRPLIVQPKVAVYGGFEGIEPYDYDLSQRNFDEHATIIDGDSAYRVLDKSCPFVAVVPTTYMTEPGTILMPTSGITDITACSGTIYDNGGETSNYSNNCNGQIILRSFSPNSTITLNGTYQTEGSTDYLNIYDYNDMTLLATYYGSGSISLTSSSSTILLSFTSGSSVNRSGFAINFTCSDCNPVIPEAVESSFRSGTSLFDGLTFQHGFVSESSGYAGAYLYANTDLINCTFDRNYRRGVYATSCNFDHCVFSNNTDYGLYCEGNTNVSNSIVEGNKYGIYFSSTGTLSNSTMKLNTYSGLRIYNGRAEGCLISDNGTYDYGVYSDGSNVRIINTSIINNNGGGLYAYNGLFVNVNIANNSTTRTSYNSAAGVCAQSNARFVNCNIVNNKATSTSSSNTNVRGGIYNYSTNNEYTNCIIWGNKTRETVGNLYGEATYSYCAVEGGVDGIANITLEASNYGEEESVNYVNFVRPTFEAGVSTQDSVDYNLAAGSACINAGNSSNTSLNLPTYDLAGSLRIKQQRIDIGAYEFGDVNILPINDEICLGDGFNYEGHLVFPEEAGMFRDTFIYNQGMNDYIAHINLQVNPVYNLNIDTTICEGETCFFNGQNYTTTTTTTAYLQTIKGCDSTVVLNLTVNPRQYSEFSATACDSYTWNDITYYESGDYEQTLQAETGCDSIATLHLTLYHSIETVDSMMLCRSSLPFVYRGVIIDENTPEHDTIPIPLLTSHGCDSTVFMRLTIVDVITTEFSDEACELYEWNNETYTTSGDKVQTFVSSIGCDSIVTLHLTIHHTNEFEFEAENCYQYVWNNQTYEESGDYQQVLTNAEGCDSTVTLHLTIHTSTTFEFTDEGCDSYVWNNQTYNESGDYQQTFTNAAGCDSIVTLHLTIYPTYQTQLEETICQGDLPYHYTNGLIDTTFDENTPELSIFNFHFSTSHGCDSTVILTFHVTPVTTPQLVVDGIITACQSSSATLSVDGNYTTFNWSNGATTPTIEVTTPGYYWVELIDINGCYSISEVEHLGISELIPETPAICMVGVENGHNLIVWEEIENTNVQNYRIYRENDQADVYELLATVPASQGNSYEDVTADPTVRAWRYKVTAMDVCQGETPMSELHKTVHLTINQGIGNTWNLIWTHYEGMEFASYKLYRGSANNNLEEIATLPATLTSYTDYDNVNGALFYQIEVVMNGTCLRRSETYTGARSNIVYNGEMVYTDTTVSECQLYEWFGTIYTQSGDYQHVYTSELGYDCTATLHLTIFTMPSISISGNTDVLLGESTTLSVTNNPEWTYLWSTGETTSSITVTPEEPTTYSVTVTNGTCEAEASVDVSIHDGIPSYDNNLLTLYPNPTNDIVNVQFTMNNGQWENAEIRVYDVYGRLLRTVETCHDASVQIDLSHYATGVYLIQLVNNGNVMAVRKVVKE